ncbi:MAG: ribose-5-phosphate isomerase RpiA [Coriobacteriia bacterium]|nr:ribose-5-phosphate isomerase RpiA [Coriobacteriia bacterium]
MGAAETAKRAAAEAAIRFVESESIIGVGTGSTVAHFVDALASAAARPARAVSTSDDSDARLRRLGIEVVPLEAAPLPLGVYVDGADEIDPQGRAIKGGGGAHTREKAVARASRVWVCIVDASKVVSELGSRSPVPLEIETNQLHAAQQAIEGMGAHLTVREHTRQRGSTLIADVHGLDLQHPLEVERRLESIDGVVACGIFAHRRADLVLVGHPDGTVTEVDPGRERGAE